jgi:hypothetical protein
MIYTENAARHLGTKIHIALAHKNISQIKLDKHLTQKTIAYNKTNL